MNQLDFLSKFIIQSGENNLKTVEYPREFDNLKMKVSFEMEIADVAIYLFRLTDVLGVDLADVMRKKMVINESRF